jgi:hypothetical protein
LPPHRRDGWKLAERSTVVSWVAVPYNRLDEWQARLECLVGPLHREDGGKIDGPWLAARYRSRDPAAVVACAERYGARYVVTDGEAGGPVRFSAGAWKVYEVAPASAP